MSTPDNLEHRIGKLHVTTRAEMDEHILNDAFAELESSDREKAATSGQSIFLKSLRNRTKELVAVAALVLFIFALFFNSPAAKAITLAQIYEAVERVRNVCILKFQAGQKEPFQKIWKARFMRVWLIETKKQTELWDLQNWTKKEIDKSTGFFSETPIQPDMRKKLEDSLTNSFGFLPFSDIQAVKRDAEWWRVEDNDITANVPGTEVYDLAWWETDGLKTYCKWRVFVDTATDLPKRTEWHQRGGYQSEPELKKIDIITYPTDDEVKVRIREIFGEVEQRAAESEGFNNPETTQINTGTEQ